MKVLSAIPRPSKALSSQISFAFFGGLLLALGVFGALVYLTTSTVDEQSISRQMRFMTHGIATALESLPKEQESSAVWDDAVLRVKANDQQWMEENLGLWMGTYFGHDQVYILNELDQPVHAMTDEKTVDASAYAAEEAAISPLVRILRGKMKAASAGLSNSTAAIAGLGAEDFVLLAGMPALVSVKPIIPSSDRMQQAAGTEYLHISVQLVDKTFIDQIASQYELADAHLHETASSEPEAPHFPLMNARGRVLGFIQWQGSKPSLETIKAVAPSLAGVIACGLALLFWLLVRLRQSSTQLEASEAQAQYLAFHDTLTGSPNRALFEDRLERALVRVRRNEGKAALLYVDLDRFKNVNDTLGHVAGDDLIRQVANRLGAIVRETDTVARLGGDEFAIVQSDIATERDAEMLAERVLKEIERPFDLGGESAFVSASIGIVLSQGPSTLAAEMHRKADIALYEAKEKGRARYEVFGGDMDDVVRRKRLIERELRDALATGTELRVAYQPLFAANGRRILGAEALVRWDHPVHGLLSPELFIGIAEERGLIEQLGEWVLRRACETALRIDLPWVAVNVSPVQFRNQLLADRVFAILQETGLPAKRLQLEITEGVLLENDATTEATLGRLRERGIRIALDDFGTGYSSMSYLKKYSVDKLKIDRSFVQQLGTSLDSDAIVRAMVTLARSMHLEVTAEGVETAEQRDHLAAIGCHELQGFLLSRPVSENELAAQLAEGFVRHSRQKTLSNSTR